MAELLSLIWLEIVKRAVVLRFGNFHFIPVGFTVAELRQRQEHFWLLRLLNAEMRESTRGAQGTTKLSTGHGPTRRLFFRSLGTRFGLVTASNDPREFAPDRVPASASIQSRGRCLHGLFLESILFLFPAIYRGAVEVGRGWRAPGPSAIRVSW